MKTPITSRNIESYSLTKDMLSTLADVGKLHEYTKLTGRNPPNYVRLGRKQYDAMDELVRDQSAKSLRLRDCLWNYLPIIREDEKPPQAQLFGNNNGA